MFNYAITILPCIFTGYAFIANRIFWVITCNSYMEIVTFFLSFTPLVAINPFAHSGMSITTFNIFTGFPRQIFLANFFGVRLIKCITLLHVFIVPLGKISRFLSNFAINLVTSLLSRSILLFLFTDTTNLLVYYQNSIGICSNCFVYVNLFL